MVGTPELERGPVVEHGKSGSGWLRDHRARVAIWIALAEGLLVLVGVIPKFAAIIIAALVLFAYFAYARNIKGETSRHVAWIATASQAFVALVPVLAIVVGTLALIVVAFIAVIALVLLFTERG